MSTISPSTLEEAIREAGEGWLIETFAPPENAIAHVRQTLQAVQQEAQKRLGGNAPDLSETALLAEYPRNLHKFRAFIQALGGTRTPEMLLMVWRILQGMEVQKIEMNYLLKQEFNMQVILVSPYGEQDAPYTSQNIHDFALIRHLGIMEIAETPVFNGFYPLRIR